MPAITKPNLHFDATTYTGTGSALSVTNGGFQPDFVWIKNRGSAYGYGLVDSVRGRASVLYSNDTAAQGTSGSTQDVTAFNSNGFALGTNSQIECNANGQSYIGWQWKAGGAAVTNNDGTISAQVSANPTAGFSVVTYTGNGTNGATVGHGLGAKPFLIIEKGRTSTINWSVQGCGELWTPVTSNLFLNGTGGLNANGAVAAPTSTVYTPSAVAYANESGVTNIAYCFAPIAGYSAFGSYTGNGSADGPFVFLGFRPRYIMIKSLVESSNWFVYDTARSPYNQMDILLFPSDPQGDYTDSTYAIDAVSNGFKIRGPGQYGGYNNSVNGYIYMAFAENPFKFSNAR